MKIKEIVLAHNIYTLKDKKEKCWCGFEKLSVKGKTILFGDFQDNISDKISGFIQGLKYITEQHQISDAFNKDTYYIIKEIPVVCPDCNKNYYKE